MTSEQAQSLKDDLREFVAQTRARLEDLLKSINELQDLDKADASDAFGERLGFFESSEPRTNDESQPHAVARPLQPLTTHQSKIGLESSLEEDNANRLDERASAVKAADSIDVASRLDAIKRRLAEQIENT